LIKEGKVKVSGVAIPNALWYVALNTSKPPFDNVKVRQAIAWAMPYEQIQSGAFFNRAVPMHGGPAEVTKPVWPQPFPYVTDLDKAKALLKEAGVTPPISVDFMVPKGAETEAVAQVVQSMASDAGFDMKIRVTEFATSLKQAEAGEYQAYLLGWSGRIDPDGNAYVFLKSIAPQNYSAWANAEADKALDDARLVTDQAKRKAIYENLAKLELGENPILYIYHRRILIAHTNKLEGYKQMPDGLVRVTGLTLK
jgi:peptide/nickel transport system substrate-binding protein